MAEIYALSDPETGAVRYIGKAVDAAKRFKGHLRERRRKTPVYRWIDALRKKGLVPVLSVLEVCASDEWQEREKALIAAHPNLLNVAEGGDEPFCDYETRARNGRATAKAIHSNPARKYIWDLKKRIGSAIRDGYLTENARQKLRKAAELRPDLFGEYASL